MTDSSVMMKSDQDLKLTKAKHLNETFWKLFKVKL